jgi:hypothetical protein
MPNHASMTYSQLYDKLRNMGFKEFQVELEGKRARVFEHPKVAASMIVLPERKPAEVVEPFELNGVVMILRSRGLLPETNPLLT